MKRLFSTITALAMAASLCMSALPVYAVDETAETPVCTCTELCTEGAVNDACPVCAEDLTQCAGKAAETPADSEGESEAETPVCTCTELCAEGAVNDACPVCAENLTQCAGKAVEPEEKPEEPETPQAPETSEEQAPSNGSNTPVTLSADGEHGTHEEYTSLQTALETSGYTLASGNYYLAEDVKLGQYDPENPTQYILTIQGNVTLCLNGHVLDLSENHIEVLGADSSLTICDCQPDVEYKFKLLSKNDEEYTEAVYIVDGTPLRKRKSSYWKLDQGGSYIVNGGVITNGDRCNQDAPAGDAENLGKGGAIYVVGGSLTLESGNIVGNRAGFQPQKIEEIGASVDGYGGAVYVENGTFTMNGGRICGNYGSAGLYNKDSNPDSTDNGYGGGVYLRNSAFYLNNGLIDNNSAGGAQYGGGAVCADSQSKFCINNGIVRENYSACGAVLIRGKSQFSMYDGAITNNKGERVAGVCVGAHSSDTGNIFNMYGGEITDNVGGVAYGSGGVLVLGEDSCFTLYKGTVSRNIGQAGIGGVRCSYNAKFIIKNGEISDNIGTSAGGVGVSDSASFVMENGVISGNKGNTVGGVSVNRNCVYTMNGGSITDNQSTITGTRSTTAGGICVSGTMNLSGGTISGNVSASKAENAQNTFRNGIYVADGGVLNLSGTPQIASADDVALYIADGTVPDAAKNTYINVNAAYTGSDASPVTVTPVLKGTTPTWLEEPSAATGTKLVVFADESAAAAADTAKWFAPSAAMLEQEPTLEVGQSHPQKTWLTFVKYADIAPAGMIIYVGGQGYTGVVDDSGTTVGTSNGFPVPGFTVTIPGVTSVEAGKLGLQYKKDETTMQWDAQLYGTGATKVYRFAPDENTGNTQVRIQFLHQNGDTQTVVDSDDFVVRDYLNQTLGMRVYGEGIAQDYVTLQYDGRAYYLRTADSQMTVRSTTDHVQYGALTNDGSAVAKDAPGVVAQSGTTYTINDSNVQVADTSGVALLFDNIIENNTNKENKSNTQLLRERVDKELENLQDLNLDEGTYRHYECKYLDLVDTKNGNAWVKASQGVTVYWPLPEGTDASTKFELLHFTDMHRDMGVSQIENKIDTCTVVRENVTVEGDHITFKTDGFSPYVLVWQTDTSSSQGDLVVSKTVAGSQGETDRLFNFTVTLSGSTLNGWYGGMEFKNGVATFQLPHNGRIMAEGLPAGITYTVTETEAGQDGYVTTVADNNATGRIAADGVTNVAFVNTKEETTEPVPSPDPGETPDNGSNNGSESGSNTPAKTPAPVQNVSAAAAPAAQAAAAVIPQTGDDSQPLMWVVLAAGSLGLLAVLLAAKRRRTDK